MFKLKSKKKTEPLISDPKKIATALEVLFATPYISRKKLYWENFVRGMAFSVGGIVGATVLIALLLWILSLFDTVPFIGPFVDNAKDTIQQSSPTK
jgi:hypothetical protein